MGAVEQKFSQMRAVSSYQGEERNIRTQLPENRVGGLFFPAVVVKGDVLYPALDAGGE